MYVSVCALAHKCEQVCLPSYMHDSQRTISSLFSPWVLGLELGWSDFCKTPFTNRTS